MENKNSDRLAQAGAPPRLLGKVAMLGESEGERERARELRKGGKKKARLGTAQSNQLLLSAFSA